MGEQGVPWAKHPPILVSVDDDDGGGESDTPDP